MHFFSVSDRRYCFDEVTRNCFQVDQASEDALRIFEASGRTVNSKLLTKSLEVANKVTCCERLRPNDHSRT